MTDSSQSAASWTRRAIHEIESGEASDARAMLAAALSHDPGYQPAWLWFASITSNPGEQRYCFEHAIKISPNAAVESSLSQLSNVTPVAPEELVNLEDAPLPEEFGGASFPSISGLPESRWRWSFLAALAAMAVAGGLLYLFLDRNEARNPIVIAMAADISGPGSVYGHEMMNSLELYVETINEHGGVNGQRLQLLVFDDQGTEDGARIAANAIVEDGRAVVVIGHRTSSASMAASPIYQSAGIPVITGTATADSLTTDNHWYFRTIFDNADQGSFLAAYLSGVFGTEKAFVISEDSSYGTTLTSGFENGFADVGGEIQGSVQLAVDVDKEATAMQEVVAQLKRLDEGATVVLATSAVLGQEVLLAIHDADLDLRVIGGDSFGSNAVLRSIAAAVPNDNWQTTNGLYAVSPLLTDSLSGDAVNAYQQYKDTYGEYPTWRGVMTVDAAVAVVQALTRMQSSIDANALPEERVRLRDALEAIDSPANSVSGLAGPIYFDENRNASRSMSMGKAVDGQFESAPIQLRLVLGEDVIEATEDRQYIEVNETTYQTTRVVFTGVEINQIRSLNINEKSYFADLFIWFTYPGNEDAVDVFIPNVADFEQVRVQDVRSGVVNGLNYKVIRVQAIFETPLDFRNFPFDEQQLEIKLQNRTLPSTDVIYAIDREFQDEPMATRLLSGAHSGESIVALQNWRAKSLELAQDSLGTTSNLGDSTISTTSGTFEYSLLLVTTIIDRSAKQFLIKNVLPLLLIAIITYISLFFSHEQTGERVSFGITGVLTGAVLLSGIGGLLPEVGYTVAIEWAYYAFMILSGLTIGVALLGGRLNANRQYSEMRNLDWAARILYPLAILAITAAYVYRFG